MKIIGTTKLSTPCIWTNIGKGIEGLNKYTNIPVIIYDHNDFTNRLIKPDTDDIVFIFEAGFGQKQNTGWDISELKDIWPNSKFIALGADISVYLYHHNRDQLNFQYVDLLLDLDSRTREHYTSKGIKTDKWLWTISDWLVDILGDINISDYDSRKFDFISVLHPSTLNGSYRRRLVNHISSIGMTFTNGGGNGHDDNDLERLFRFYNNSKIALGVSNLGFEETFLTMKGFRDFLAPFFDIPILYDRWEQAEEAYGDIMPYYEYSTFSDLYDKSQLLLNNPSLRQNYIEKQKRFAIDNTIDKQLFNILTKYKYI